MNPEYRPRILIEARDMEQFNNLNELFPRGTRNRAFWAIFDDLIELAQSLGKEKWGQFLGMLISREINYSQLSKDIKSLKDN